MKSSYWVVIPIYNEENYLESLLKHVVTYTSNLIIVDDGSKDRSAEIAAQFTPYVLKHELNLGKGAALKTGCEFAFNNLQASSIIMLDGDAQHDPKEITLFVDALDKGFGFIQGTRSLWEMPFFRSWGSRAISAMIAVLYGAYVPDILSGFKAFTKNTYEKIKWESRGYGVEMEIASRIAQLKIPLKSIVIKTIYHDFDRGMTVLDTISAFLQIIKFRFRL